MRLAALVLLAGLAAPLQADAPLTTDDIVRFLRAGISERTILLELGDRGFRDPLDAAREASLREAGASESLVVALRRAVPDPALPAQRVAFGTSGHRGSSLDASFNESHVLAISQAICRYRRSQDIDGPLFLGIDTHALSPPACETALEVLAANDVEVRDD